MIDGRRYYGMDIREENTNDRREKVLWNGY